MRLKDDNTLPEVSGAAGVDEFEGEFVSVAPVPCVGVLEGRFIGKMGYRFNVLNRGAPFELQVQCGVFIGCRRLETPSGFVNFHSVGVVDDAVQ